MPPGPSLLVAGALAALALAMPADPPWFTDLEPARQARHRADFGRAGPLARQQAGVARRGVRIAAMIEGGWQQIAQGKYASAEPSLESARQAALTTLGQDHPVYALALAGQAALKRRNGPLAEAEGLLEQSLGILEEAVGPAHSAYGGAVLERARWRRAMGRLAESRADAQAALEAFGAASPMETAAAWHELAETELAEGNVAGARERIGRALQAWESAAGPIHPGHAAAMAVRAELALMAGNHVEAESLGLQALMVSEKTLGPEHPELATPLARLARIYLALGNPQEADRLGRRLDELFRLSGGGGALTPAWTVPMQAVAEVRLAAGDRTGAAQLMAAVQQARRGAGLNPRAGLPVESQLHLASQRMELARQTQAEYLAAVEAVSANHAAIPEAAAALSQIAMMEGRFSEAEQLTAKAIRVAEAALGAGARCLNRLFRMQAQSLAAQGRAREAILPADNALRILETGRGAADPEWAPTLNVYSALLKQTGRLREAAEMERRATSAPR